jgi:hypothetical protein
MYFRRRIQTLGCIIEKETIALAAKLLVKAEVTSSDAEAAALMGRAYRLLAEALNADDDTTTSEEVGRKRERRLLRDRRSTSGPAVRSGLRPTTEPAAVRDRHIHWNDLPSGGQVDLRM